MVQQNSNKLNTALYNQFKTSSNPANRKPLNPFITHNFFAVRPEGELDVHPCGLNRICEHPCATKLKEWLSKWCVSPTLRRRTTYLQQSLTILVLGRIHAWMMAMSQWSDQWQAQDRCPNSCSTPTKTHTVVHKLLQLHFCLLKQLSSISTTLPHCPRQPPLK